MSRPANKSIEEQLAQYRNRKRKEEIYKSKKKRAWDIIVWIMSFGSKPSEPVQSSDNENSVSTSSSIENKSELVNDEKTVQEQCATSEEGLRRRSGLSKDSLSEISSDHSDVQGLSQLSFIDTYTTLDWISLGLKFVMWMLLFKVFILLEFGAVYFIFSAFIFIWYNMRSGPKKEGEISAYSVFNQNCEVIHGTFTAEQFERELLHKM